MLPAPGLGADPVRFRSPTRQASGNLDLERLPLSPQLKDDLHAWERLVRRAQQVLDTSAGEQDLRAWATRAREDLLPRLRQELGADYDVQFIGDLHGA